MPSPTALRPAACPLADEAAGQEAAARQQGAASQEKEGGAAGIGEDAPRPPERVAPEGVWPYWPSSKETLALNVRSCIATAPNSLITVTGCPGIRPCTPVPCTMRTGNDSGSMPGGTGPGPDPNLSTVVLPV